MLQGWRLCIRFGQPPNPPFPPIIKGHKTAFYMILYMGGTGGNDGRFMAAWLFTGSTVPFNWPFQIKKSWMSSRLR